jgi:D-glycero-alpha-D-manno-heptose-7-phosphate kinase
VPELRYITALAPIRVCDCGGWTDTWFARQGRVCHVAVAPYVEVQIAVGARRAGAPRVVVHAENFGARYVADPGDPARSPHPLIDAAIAHMGVPEDLAVEITIYSDMPAGASTGTSASVTVALVGALDALTPGRLAPMEVAYAAHAIEVDRLGGESGIQDQVAASIGGISFLEVDYPRATVTPVRLADETRWELEQRLMLVYLGRIHDSLQVHRRVIDRLQADEAARRPLETLSATATAARDALEAGDLQAYGAAMREATEGQSRLHPALVSDEARALIALAAAHGAIGWKVNGAGGEGGSLTLLAGPSGPERRALALAIGAAGAGWQVVPTHLARQGLRVWEGANPADRP